MSRAFCSGRAARCVHVLLAVAHEKVGAVWPIERASGAGIAAAAGAQHLQVFLLEIDRRAIHGAIKKSFQRQDRGGDGGVAGAGRKPAQQTQHLMPCGRHGDAKSRHLRLDRRKPGGVEPSFREEAIAAAHGALEVAGAAAMTVVERQDEPVEETAAIGGGAGEEPVHRRRQPQHAQMIGELFGGFGRRAVDAQLARHRLALVRFDACTDRDFPFHAVEIGKDGETCRRAYPRDIGQHSAAQAPSRRQEGDRFQQVGFAGTVLSGQHHMPPVECQRGLRIVAKVGELQPGEGGLLRHQVSWVRCSRS